jgi:hypothetical protein
MFYNYLFVFNRKGKARLALTPAANKVSFCLRCRQEQLMQTRGVREETPPLGVASTLRRVKSKAPALQYRAESPVINSTGQRPVWKGHSPINKPQRGEIKSNNRISP